MNHAPLIDSFGRVHTSLRVSVTDRCNIRCFYCMPEENVQFKPRHEILSFEEIERFVAAASLAGVRKLRLTGGEPLVRAAMPELVQRLAAVPGIEEVTMTTNGILLADHAVALKRAGLHRLNISLDTLSEETFRRISRRDGLDRVIAGIRAARAAGFEQIRLNAVAIKGITDSELVPLVRFAQAEQAEMRFIEFMPLDADHNWQAGQVLTGEEMRRILTAELGKLHELPREDPSRPAANYQASDGTIVGFIDPVSHPFCSACDRLRLTAEGRVRNCLFSTVEWDARTLLRNGASSAEIIALLRECIAAKKAGHGIDDPSFSPPERAMYQIGG